MSDAGLEAAFEYLHSRADYREGRYWLLDEDIHQLVNAIEQAAKPAASGQAASGRAVNEKLASLEASVQGLRADIAKLVEMNRLLCGNESASATGLIEGRVSTAMELAGGHHVQLAKELGSILETDQKEKS